MTIEKDDWDGTSMSIDPSPRQVVPRGEWNGPARCRQSGCCASDAAAGVILDYLTNNSGD